MKDDIKLPPLPKGDIDADTCPVMWVHTDQQMENYAREAIKADRQRRSEPVVLATYHVNELSRAIAQAVLQLPEIQALRKDAERYRWLKKQFRIMSLDMGGNHTWVLQRPLREGCSIDAVCDASMEKQQ